MRESCRQFIVGTVEAIELTSCICSGLGLRILEFRALGIQVLGVQSFRVSGRVFGFQGFRVSGIRILGF